MQRLTIAVLPTLIGAFVISGSPAYAQETFEWEGRLGAGKVLEIRTISGDIAAVRASGARAEVVATMRGRRSDFDEIDVEVIEEGDGVTICVTYPDRRRGRTGCGRDGWNGSDIEDLDVSVDFEVRVPDGVEFMPRAISGDIEAEGLTGPVDASTVSGSIRVSTTDIARATTVSGSIRASMGRADWRHELRFNTVSGDITVELPANANTDVEFESLSGDFVSDFENGVRRFRERWVGSAVEGTIGSGGRLLSLQTVSGDVRLHTRR